MPKKILTIILRPVSYTHLAGTGGFSNKGISIGAYNSRYIEIVLAIMMAVFGVNFNIYFYAVTKNVREAVKSEELKWYIAIILIASGLIFANIVTIYKDRCV